VPSAHREQDGPENDDQRAVRIAAVIRSPSKRIASTVETQRRRLRIAAETEAPTFDRGDRKSRPAAVPTTPDAMKYGAACQL
jgi:hypothetical protein